MLLNQGCVLWQLGQYGYYQASASIAEARYKRERGLGEPGDLINEITPTFIEREDEDPLMNFSRNLPTLYDDAEFTFAHRRALLIGAKAKMTFRVVDVDDVPIEGVTLRWQLNRGKVLGFSRARKVQSDAGGLITISGRCTGIIKCEFKHEGYQDVRFVYQHSLPEYQCVKYGRWQPWNPVILIILSPENIEQNGDKYIETEKQNPD